MSFANALQAALNKTNTENGAVAHKTTQSFVLDFFSQAGALRLGKTTAQAPQLFALAYAEDKNLALKSLFYIRDVRGGQGEREVFRACINWIANKHPEDIEHLVAQIQEFGRWDDLFSLYGTKLENAANTVIANQLSQDIKAERPSLLAKWLKSENTSSKVSRAIARATRQALRLDSKTYRKILTSLRAKIELVEASISANRWTDVNYSHVPSNAGKKYKNAFRKHDSERYSAFHVKVEKGEAKMNVKTLYPYEIIKETGIYAGSTLDRYAGGGVDWQYIQNAWKSLPDYFKGKQEDMLVVADVSGSMQGDPLFVSISLAMYAAEHNKGVWHGKFMTFSSQPTFISFPENATMMDKINILSKAPWNMNTDINAVFEKVHGVATATKSCVSRIVIVSDMEFDACSRTDKTVFEKWKGKFEAAGFEMPGIVFWNVASRNGHFAAQAHEGNVQLVSGLSPSTYEQLCENKFLTPYEYMVKVVTQPRYDVIVVA